MTRTERLTPHFINVTLASDGMSGFEYLGFDQEVRLFFTRRHQTEVRLPDATGNGWIPKFFLTPQKSRPHLRNYTIRACRPEAGELDIEFVVHGDDSPASYWATHAQPGDEVGLFPEGVQYLPTPTADVHLLVADESAVPAVLSILDHAPATLRAEVFLEVPTAADIRAVPELPDVHVHWLPRDGRDDVPGRLALETVRGARLPIGELYCFTAGESGLPTGLRRHLVSDQGLPKSSVTFVGYWKQGRSTVD
ncbi:siderophore-interacting protein [Streptomyces solisilvae]|uniref:siderophore-interacting protein n=1 Tax=Streptomyces malaysiensis TaxID=92644 RepID=UPI00368BC21A